MWVDGSYLQDPFRNYPNGVADAWPCSFVPPSIARKYDFEVPEYKGIDQVVEVTSTGEKL